MKHIGMVLDNPYTGDNRVINEARALQNGGNEVYVLALNYGQHSPIEDMDGVRIRRILIPQKLKNYLFAFQLRLPFYDRFWEKEILAFIDEFEIDVIHAHLFGPGVEASIVGLITVGIVIAILVDTAGAAFRTHILDFPFRRTAGVSPMQSISRLWFVNDLITFVGVMAAGFARDFFLRNRVRDRETVKLQAHAAQLQAQLADARLEALRMQLNPHFLFNTLHAVSALVERDPRGVRRMIARLSELLRYTLSEESEQEITVEQELDFLRRYLEIAPAAPDAVAVSRRIGQLEVLARQNMPDPGTALTLGMLLPGLGQFYTGRTELGLALLGLSGGAVAAGLFVTEVHVRCLVQVEPGRGCPAEHIVDRRTERPYLGPALGLTAGVLVFGAVEALVRARDGGGSSAVASSTDPRLVGPGQPLAALDRADDDDP